MLVKLAGGTDADLREGLVGEEENESFLRRNSLGRTHENTIRGIKLLRKGTGHPNASSKDSSTTDEKLSRYGRQYHVKCADDNNEVYVTFASLV